MASAGTGTKSITAERAKLKRLSEDARREVTQGLDLGDLDNLRTKSDQAQTTKERAGTQGSSRLQAAHEFGKKMQEELGAICIGVEEGLAQIGYSVTESYNFQGKEKFWAFIGNVHRNSLEKAKVLRYERLRTQNVDASVKEITNRGVETIEQLGEVEKDFAKDAKAYNLSLTYILERLKEAQPGFAKAKSERESLEAQVKTLKMELESGTVSEAERPAKEEEYDNLQREYQAVLLNETDLLEIVNNAQRAIPEVQKNRDAALQAVQSYHQMRRGLFEVMKNFEEVMKNAMTSVRAQARLERYNDYRPAFNKTATLVTEHNVKHAGAAMQTAIEQASKAALTPADSLRLAQEMRGIIEECLKGLNSLEEEAQKGVRVPVEPGYPDSSDREINDEDGLK
ncbi:MAG: hypothetical protein Q7S43_05115 [bacterium]|nr:hypothetical protein [bacterium]